jgi:ABC-type transporter Mla subunit MlaD
MDDTTKPQANEPTVEDAEIVEDVQTESTTDTASETSIEVADDTDTSEHHTPDTQAIAYLESLTSSINIAISKVERLKTDLTPVKEMIDSLLKNDPQYMELSEKAKQAATEKGKRKKDLMSTQNGRALTDKLKSLQDDLKETNESLSQYLSEYQKTTGATEFEGSDGELRQIVYVAKLVRKTSLNRE